MKSGIRCIVGLGNPGPRYHDTRHNAGFWFVDQIAREFFADLRPDNKFFGDTASIDLHGSKCWLLKPTVYMNRSGQSVSAICNYFDISPDELLIAHDELDLPPGTVKFKTGGGHGGHNGLRDICAALGDKNFHRLRIGVGHPGHKDMVVDYVLNRASKTDQEQIDSAIERAAKHTEDLAKGRFQAMMNALHSV
ncbi:MAG: aminoacyl-tRNA hydrolase [bacterium]